jgi:hypothetical protein
MITDMAWRCATGTPGHVHWSPDRNTAVSVKYTAVCAQPGDVELTDRKWGSPGQRGLSRFARTGDFDRIPLGHRRTLRAVRPRNRRRRPDRPNGPSPVHQARDG